MRNRSFSIQPVKPSFILMAFSTVLCVLVAQVLMSFLPPLPPVVREVLPSALALALLFPFGYFLIALPVSNFIAKSRQAKTALSKSEMHYRVVSELTTTFVFDLLLRLAKFPDKRICLWHNLAHGEGKKEA